MTRGVECLLHEDVVSAFLFNPLGMIMILGSALYLAYAAIVVSVRLPRFRWEGNSKSAALFFRCAAMFLVAGNWMYLIWHERIMRA